MLVARPVSAARRAAPRVAVVLRGPAAARGARHFSGEAAVDVAARRAKAEEEVAAAADKHQELVAYLADTMAASSASGEGAPPLPELRPASSFQEPANAAEAWRVQQAVVRRIKEKHSLRHIGYKLGATSDSAQQRLGLAEPFLGPIFAERLFSSGVQFSLEQLQQRETVKGVELEIGFNTGAPFHAGEFYSARAVKESLAELWAVAELPAHRFTPDSEVSGLMTIADCGGTGNFVLANRFPHNWQLIDDVGLVYCDLVRDDDVVQKGIAQNVMETPINAASYAANFMAQEEAVGIPKGVFVSTGTMTDLQPLAPGEIYRGLFKRDEEKPVGWLGFTIASE